MQKNDELIGVVTSLGYNYEGIVKIDGTVCFVPFSLVGEKIRFKVLKVSKNIAYCKLLEVLTPADNRVRYRCPVFYKCGGCQLQHLKYTDQLKEKSKTIKECFSKIAGLKLEVLPTVKSVDEYEYRNKLQLPIRQTDFGVKIGFFAENSHRIIEITECPLHKDWATKIISVFSEYINNYNIPCYNEETKEGILKHVVVRKVNRSFIIIAVINGGVLPKSDLLINKLKATFTTFSFFTCVNENTNNVILTDDITLLFGPEKFYLEEGGIKYAVGPKSFMQVNDNVKLKLYDEVIKNLDLNENSVVIDAYSGAGLMSGLISLKAKKVIGIEIVKEAVDSANALAKENGLTDKLVNICAPCEDVLPQIIQEESKTTSVSVVLDPPRKGCDVKVLNAILKAKPNKIVYVSCSPQTLARDIGILTGNLVYEGNELKKVAEPNGLYKVTKVKPYDMFPQTKHVETVVLLSREKVDDYVHIAVHTKDLKR